MLGRRLLLLFAWVALGLLFPAPACSQEQAGQAAQAPAQAHGTTAHGGEHPDEESGGVFGWALDLAIWTIVVFLVLLWVLSKYAWKPMLEGLQRREQNIRAALDEAQRAREEAERVRVKLQAEMDHASEKVRDMLDAARRDAQRATDEMIAKARKDVQTDRERLHHEIDMARDQALQQIWTQTAQLATLVSAKAIRRQLNPDDHRRLLTEAIAELQRGNGESTT
jgi:F-type H+-transporting ATPase subunit b